MSERPPKTVMDRVFDVVGVIMGTFFALSITAGIGATIYGAVVDDDTGTRPSTTTVGWYEADDGSDWGGPVDDGPDWGGPSTPVGDEIGIRVGAICEDGTYSSATGRGACSWHGGVAEWLYE